MSILCVLCDSVEYCMMNSEYCVCVCVLCDSVEYRMMSSECCVIALNIV